MNNLDEIELIKQIEDRLRQDKDGILYWIKPSRGRGNVGSIAGDDRGRIVLSGVRYSCEEIRKYITNNVDETFEEFLERADPIIASKIIASQKAYNDYIQDRLKMITNYVNNHLRMDKNGFIVWIKSDKDKNKYIKVGDIAGGKDGFSIKLLGERYKYSEVIKIMKENVKETYEEYLYKNDESTKRKITNNSRAKFLDSFTNVPESHDINKILIKVSNSYQGYDLLNDYMKLSKYNSKKFLYALALRYYLFDGKAKLPECWIVDHVSYIMSKYKFNYKYMMSTYNEFSKIYNREQDYYFLKFMDYLNDRLKEKLK